MRRLLLASLLVLSLAFAGCGDDGGDGEGTGATEAASTTEATTPAPTVKVPSQVPSSASAAKVEQAAAFGDARVFCHLFDAALLKKQYGGETAAEAARAYVEGVYPPALQESATRGCIAGVGQGQG